MGLFLGLKYTKAIEFDMKFWESILSLVQLQFTWPTVNVKNTDQEIRREKM